MSNSVFSDISYGLYVIGSKNADKINAQIANTVMQVSANPQKLIICLNKLNLTHDYILESKVFSVSVISTEWTLDDIGKFGFRSGRDFNKFSDAIFKIGKTGSPILTDRIISALECEVLKEIDVGTHNIFLGNVINIQKFSDAFPMTYKFYHDVVKGFTPANAPVSG